MVWAGSAVSEHDVVRDHVADLDAFGSASFPALPLPATGREVAQFLALRAAACVGADYSNVALLDPTGDSLRVYHDAALEQEIAKRYTDIPLDAPFPLTQAARGRVAVLLGDLDAYRQQFPDIVADTVAAGYQATASLPLNRTDGSPLGAIGFAWTEPTLFDAKLEAALRAVVYLCAEMMERAERYDAEHTLMVELQDRLLGDIPTLAGIQTVARYLPATRVPYVGGDWYEGLLVGESKMAVLVGDVTGHGVAAAADVALVRGMVSALLHAGIAVSDVFPEVSGVIEERKGMLLATAALAVVDLATDTLTFATAGHPPPLLLLPDGEVRTLSTANGPIIGVSTTRAVADTAPFPPGARLVMYTDGLVERRGRSFDVGVAEAARHLATLSHPLSNHDLLDSLLKALTADESEDDIAIIVVEHE
ncbi:MAG TPA: PP2C family protein-serine/threonine phosphatase [Acidimicrobiia bacterium]|nr:PP2C family protein-serine/threonine phosphatase [Acidimicrobiia bacterium]